MTSPRFFLPFLVACGLLAGCAGDDTLMDVGVSDVDAGVVVDAGVRALCPPPEQAPRCHTASDCQDDRTKPPRCEFCVPANDAICRMGRCETPPRLEQAQSILFSFNAPDLVNELATFARFAVTAETSGGLEITCADVLSGTVDWSEQCYNVIDSRANDRGETSGGSFTVLFSRIPAGQKTLFVVYGFEEDDAAGAPIGVACEAHMVPEAGATSSMTEVSGGQMRSLR